MIEIQVVHSILSIEPSAWDQIAHPDFPFSQYHFLSALETTECLGRRTGWQPQFLLAKSDDRLIGALVLYLKTNSYGEYIFDFAWANAFQQCGLAYFPKLTSAIPFTPATGPKLLLDPTSDQQKLCAKLLLEAADALATQLKVSSSHALFLPDDQLEFYREAGYFLRDSYQFHWHNQNYLDMADFLAKLRSKRRREVQRERAQVAAKRIQIERISGGDLTPEHAQIFYQFYLSTIDKNNSFDYLTEAFFQRVFATIPDRLLFVLARDADARPVAGALNYFGPQTLYGRHWGCLAEYKALHFEVCYYQGIEFAIERGLRKFEAGAQGEHKFQRGFLPNLTYSAHRIASPELGRAIRDHVQYERKEIAALFLEYGEHSPFAQV